ncbi:MAG: SbtA family thio(seleno)oxazole RiPP natural product precursor [Thermodesulfobacteriota bacterium]|nr:SbtA family thio(seleno)oxazole RiPP natural product precursor [Thermodesulfobacteriota bacterium]
MESDTLKKFLGGLCIAALLSGAGLTVTGCKSAGKSS